VERGDLADFLDLYLPGRLPSGGRLREMMNSFVFGIEGTESAPGEMHLVPEIRRFFCTFHRKWPYWLHFCNLDEDTLWAMTMCCLPKVNTWQVSGRTTVAVTGDAIDLLTFITRDLTRLMQMCDRAGMAAGRISEPTKAVFEYFGLSSDGTSE
jgi:hypothetical protein